MGSRILTDGKYVDDRNDRATYLAAQERQAEYLLDQVRCGPGTRLLDIGCGYGRILEQAERRGARAIGITISPPQVAADRARGLDVRELNYRNIFCQSNPPLTPPYKRGEDSWEHAFDAIVANGSLEHFVQAADAAAGRADEIYEELFAICRRLLVDGGRFVTTAIHFREEGQFDPAAILPRAACAPAAEATNINMRCWLSPSAAGTRSQGNSNAARGLTSNSSPKKMARTTIISRASTGKGNSFARLPTIRGCGGRLGSSSVCDRGRPCGCLRLQLFDQSWPWQFRPPAPMRLLRQTWEAK